MKKIKFLGVAMAAVLLLLTSCLGETKNEGSLNFMPGKMRFDGGKLLVDIPGYGTIYSSQFMAMDFNAGDWMYVSFDYNNDSPENANAEENGYTIVTLTVSPTKIDRMPVNNRGLDMETAIDGEFPLAGAAVGGDFRSFLYFNGDLMITSAFKALTDQRNEFYMIFDASQEPEKEADKNVYNIYIRGVELIAGKTPSINTNATNVYDVEYIMSTLNRKESAEGKESFGLKFNYVKEIDEETKEVKWEAQQDIVTVGVSKETDK